MGGPRGLTPLGPREFGGGPGMVGRVCRTPPLIYGGREEEREGEIYTVTLNLDQGARSPTHAIIRLFLGL